MTGGYGGDFRCVGDFVSAPRDVQIRTQQEQVVSVNVARRLIGDAERMDWRTVSGDCGRKLR